MPTIQMPRIRPKIDPRTPEPVMPLAVYRLLLIALGGGFAVAFALIVLPPLLREPDVLGAFAAGFVNPYASGYALDAILCWCVLAVWVIHEARTAGVRHGWIALVLGVVPGVATGFAVYLLLRLSQRRNA
jgi:hypothetical protein